MANDNFDLPRPTDPVPSSTSAVINDDAKVLDYVINSTGTVVTRTGKTLLTLDEAIKKFGFGVADFTFTTGGTLNSLNLLVSNSPVDGFLYKYVGPGDAPIVVPPGSDPTVGSIWQAFAATDHNLLSGRNPADGSAHNAADILMPAGGTLADLTLEGTEVGVAGLPAKELRAIAELGASKTKRKSCINTDMHFSALKGTGWTDGEFGGSATYPVASAYSEGATQITVLDPSAVISRIVDGQLIVYTSGGEYYTARLKSRSGLTLNLSTPLEGPITTSDTVHAAYINSSHCNPFGFYAIADQALRDASDVNNIVYENSDSAFTVLRGSETITSQTINGYQYPGSSLNTHQKIETNEALAGCVTVDTLNLPSNSYRAEVLVGFGSVGGLINDIEIGVLESVGGGAYVLIASADYRGIDSSGKISVDFCTSKDSDVRVFVRVASASSAEFYVSKVTVSLLDADLRNSLDGNKHVLFGDSWIAYGDITDRLIDRLPNSEIVEKGVGGNKAADLLARFDTDVAPESPDYVWIMCGTNDYYSGVPQATFTAQINEIKGKCYQIGAIPIVFNPSVGNVTSSTTLQQSRNYAINGAYGNQAGLSDIVKQPVVSEVELYNYYIDEITVAAGAEAHILTAPGTTTKAVTVQRSFFNAADPLVKVRIGFRGNIGAPTETVTEYAANTLIDSSGAEITTGTPAGGRFVGASIKNDTVSPVTIKGYMLIRYTL